MEKNNQILFRYANAKYHPELASFSHHKHIGNKIIESTEPELIDVLIEINELILSE